MSVCYQHTCALCCAACCAVAPALPYLLLQVLVLGPPSGALSSKWEQLADLTDTLKQQLVDTRWQVGQEEEGQGCRQWGGGEGSGAAGRQGCLYLFVWVRGGRGKMVGGQQ